MEELTAYAKQKKRWNYSLGSVEVVGRSLIPALDQFQKWGVRGIKVDFMQRSDQILIDYYYRVSRECAKRKMLVDFHGDQKPASMTRTWPNLISTEGVRGMEWSKWSAESEPKHNVTLPFTADVSWPHGLHAGRNAECNQAEFRTRISTADGNGNTLSSTWYVCSI